MMTTKSFQASKSQKILIISSSAFVALFSVAAFQLWQVGKMPSYVVAISLAILLLLIVRFVTLTRFPVVELRDNQMSVIGWFGGRTQFDLSAPIEFTSSGNGIVMKQSGSGAGLGKYVVGQVQFDEILEVLRKTDIRTCG